MSSKRTVEGYDPVQDDECVCPECGSITIARKSRANPALRTHPEDYWCRNCSTHFSHAAIEVVDRDDDTRPRDRDGRYRERADVTSADAQDDTHEDATESVTAEDIAESTGVDAAVVRMAVGDDRDDTTSS